MNSDPAEERDSFPAQRPEIHRDYSIAGGATSLAIFDDRVEVWSTGRFPSGITPAALKRDHLSVLRNPIIADAFHRSGLIEKWGRGTNRVAEMCVAAGIAAPEFQELTGGAVVTFRVPVVGSGAGSGGQSGGQSNKVLNTLRSAPLSASEIASGLGLKARTGALRRTLGALLREDLVALTIPDKPNSRLQKYRLTSAGRAVLAKTEGR